jgi:hypothetical protein
MRRVLFIIESDPRACGRPAEAVRIAAGIAAGKRIAASIYLRGLAVWALGNSDDNVDGDLLERFLPELINASGSIRVQAGEPLLDRLPPSRLPFAEMTDRELALWVAQHHHVATF